jgi:hypothetical protein
MLSCAHLQSCHRDRTGAKVASKRPILRLTAAVRYLATAPTPTFSRYLHFPTRGVIFLLAVFWTFVLGEPPHYSNLVVTEPVLTYTLPRVRSLELRRHTLLPLSMDRRLPTPGHPNGYDGPRRLPLHPRLRGQMEPGHLRHRIFSRETPSVPPMVQPTVFRVELVAYLSVRHGRKRDQAEQGWVEPEGFDADWV